MSRIKGTAKAATREAIFRAAIELLSEIGLKATLEGIAERAGVSRQSAYLHFGSRTGLFVALVQYADATGGLHERVQRVFEAPTALEALDLAAIDAAEYYPQWYPTAKVFMAGKYEDDAMRVAWDDRMQARRGLLKTLIEWLQREKTLSREWDVETATDALWAITSWEVWELLVIDRRWSRERYLKHLRTLMRRTLTDEVSNAGRKGTRVRRAIRRPQRAP